MAPDQKDRLKLTNATTSTLSTNILNIWTWKLGLYLQISDEKAKCEYLEVWIIRWVLDWLKDNAKLCGATTICVNSHAALKVVCSSYYNYKMVMDTQEKLKIDLYLQCVISLVGRSGSQRSGRNSNSINYTARYQTSRSCVKRLISEITG